MYCIKFGVTGHVRCQHKPVKGKGEQDEDLQKDADHCVFTAAAAATSSSTTQRLSGRFT